MISYTPCVPISTNRSKKKGRTIRFGEGTILGAGIKAKTLHIGNANLSAGILDAAKKAKADVIVMASHKRTGIKGMLLGSETHEVIVHAALPVLVLA